ncbi:MAG: tetratricopeptide repeat protein, partial [Planctomycetota bacterium]
GRPGRALELLDQPRRADVDEAALQRVRADALHSLGRVQDAAQAVRASIAAGARNADTYNLLGVTLYEAGRMDDARESFERALVLEPGHADARANLAAMPAA